MAVLPLLIFCLWLGTARSGPCKQDWQYFGNSCYAFAETKLHWAGAQGVCRAAGGKLAEIETLAENEFLKSELSRRHGEGYWIGGTDMFHEGAWSWITTGELLSFKDWYAGEPADWGGDQDCACMWRDYTYQWGDHFCTFETYFICEAEPKEVVYG